MTANCKDLIFLVCLTCGTSELDFFLFAFKVFSPALLALDLALLVLFDIILNIRYSDG